MWWRLCLPALALLTCLGLSALPADQVKTSKSRGGVTPPLLEANPIGWIDLLAGKDLKDWKRVPIPPGGKLKEKNPWHMDETGKLLRCDGVGYHEMLLYNKEFADGIFHVEWRFLKVGDKKGYNSGVYMRNSADGKVWHQAQVGSKNVGYIFGKTLVDDKLVGISKNQLPGPQRGKEAGEWNTFEITCKGKSVSLWVNGATTAVWNSCEVPRGYLGLEAEGWIIDFKNLKFQEAK